MPIIQWTDKFSIGDAELDAQHRIWISIYNKAHDRMMDPDETNFQSTGLDALIEMQEYGQTHFASEEAYMERIAYPKIDAHKMMHDRFSREINLLIHDLKAGKFVLNSEVIKRIENWLTHHILKEDVKIRDFTAQAGS